MTDPGLRAISIDGFVAGRIEVDAGAVPMLQWVDIDKLVVDPSYQRDIGDKGRANVSAIAANFRWTRFSPVVVSPVAGGLFAIIDGQHRTTAALLRGFAQVPCQIIIADRAEQADAFRAINANVTRTNPMQIHLAAIVAGDETAIEVDRIVTACGVRVLRSNRSAEAMKAGDTMAVAAIYRVRKDYGPQVLERALRCITKTTNNVPGAVNALNVLALGEMLAGDLVLRESGALLFHVFNRIELEMEAMEFQQSRGARVGRASSAFAAHLNSLAHSICHQLKPTRALQSPPPPQIRGRSPWRPLSRAA